MPCSARNSSTARRQPSNDAVVVDDQVAAGREAGVEAVERQARRLVGVAVEPDDRPAAAGQRRQRLLEEARHELDAAARGRSARSSSRTSSSGHREEVERAEVERRRRRRRRRGKPCEGVGDADRALVAERVERRAHQDRRPAAPGAGLDQVALDAVGDHGLDAAPGGRRAGRRPTIVSPCSGQSMPAARRRQSVAAQLARQHACRPASRRPTSCSCPARSQRRELEQLEVGRAQRLGSGAGRRGARLAGARRAAPGRRPWRRGREGRLVIVGARIGSRAVRRVAKLESPLPASLPAGAPRRVFCCGTCLHRARR